MQTLRRIFALVSLSGFCGEFAAAFPVEPIRLRVGDSPGGPNDHVRTEHAKWIEAAKKAGLRAV